LLNKNINRSDNLKKEKNRDIFVLIITGVSGAGKTSVIRSLEDIGFYCVDNLPLPLLDSFLKLIIQTNIKFFKVALVIDIRGHGFLKTFEESILRLKMIGNFKDIKVIFVNAKTSTLIKRFQETRRNHPLGQSNNLLSAIKQEKCMMKPIIKMSDMTLDTDSLSVHELRKWINDTFSENKKQNIIANLVSFGFKYGVPTESNFVYDLRFLPNPYFVPELKPLNGKNKAVQSYLFDYKSVQSFWELLSNFLKNALQQFNKEGFFCVTISIGCTGGKHRSVAFVESLSNQIWPGVTFLTNHRDLGRE
jgi:RNase adapter protein RapZ